MTHLPSLAGLDLHRIVPTSGGPRAHSEEEYWNEGPVVEMIDKMVAILGKEDDMKEHRPPPYIVEGLTARAVDLLRKLQRVEKDKVYHTLPNDAAKEMPDTLINELKNDYHFNNNDITKLAELATSIEDLLYERIRETTDPSFEPYRVYSVARQFVNGAEKNKGLKSYAYLFCMLTTRYERNMGYGLNYFQRYNNLHHAVGM